METKKLDVIYVSDDYGNFPEKVVIELTDEIKETINKSINFLKKNKSVFSVNVEIDLDIEDDTNFVVDVSYIVTYSNGLCYVYGQNKYDSRLNFETESFQIK